MSSLFLSSQNDQSTGEIKVIGGDDLSSLTGKVRSMKGSMTMNKQSLLTRDLSLTCYMLCISSMNRRTTTW